MNEESILYCPFCGNMHPEAWEDEDGTGTVYCDFCNARISGYKTKADAIRQWNHRYKQGKHFTFASGC